MFCTFSKYSFWANKSFFLLSSRFIIFDSSRYSFIYSFWDSCICSLSFCTCSKFFEDCSIFSFWVVFTICSKDSITLSYSSRSGLVHVGQFDSRPRFVMFSIFFEISAISFCSPAISWSSLFSCVSIWFSVCFILSSFTSRAFSFAISSIWSFVSNSNCFIVSFAFVYCSLNSFCSKSNPSFLIWCSFSFSCSFILSCSFIYSSFTLCNPLSSICLVLRLFSSFESLSWFVWCDDIVFFRSSHLACRFCFCSFVFVYSSNSCFIVCSSIFVLSKSVVLVFISFCISWFWSAKRFYTPLGWCQRPGSL